MNSVAASECTISRLTCHVNRQVARNTGNNWSKKLDCKTDGKEVYVPFSFVRNQYEAYGDFVTSRSGLEYEISQSYSKVYSPKTEYLTGGPYMHFKYFDVESRSRVKCVSAAEGVPLSTQWDPEGYFYP